MSSAIDSFSNDGDEASPAAIGTDVAYYEEEAWERAVESALEGQADSSSSPRTLTLDGAVKCLHGRLPPPALLEKFQNLELLSVANTSVSSLERFPCLRNLQRLTLSDNRISGGLEFLVEAGLDSLCDLDLSNNRIQLLEDLAPLAQLRLVSLDLYECPVTRIKDYRSKVFGMIRSLKYLDKMDADENERPESDDEEEDEEEEEEEEEIDGDDPGSGEIDGEERGRKVVNGVGRSGDGVVVVDEDEESDADEEETEIGARRGANGTHHHHSNGFRVAAVGEEVDDDGDEDDDIDDDDDEYDEEDGDDDEMGEEIDADDGEDEDVVEVHDVGDSDEDEDGVQEEEEEDDELDDEEEEEEEVDDEEEVREPVSAGRMMGADGEIDGHDHGEDDENETGEIGEADEQGVEEERDSGDDDGDEVNSLSN